VLTGWVESGWWCGDETETAEFDMQTTGRPTFRACFSPKPGLFKSDFLHNHTSNNSTKLTSAIIIIGKYMIQFKYTI